MKRMLAGKNNPVGEIFPPQNSVTKTRDKCKFDYESR
jgi:hypothetical protein